MKIAVIGGGAAGFFGAIRAAEVNKDAEVIILEKSDKLLSKVRISGGGRCNVTHAMFDPLELCSYYPRGNKELRSVFNRFQPADTIEWFESRGVPLKTEEDGRIFPVSDQSSSIIDCLTQEAERLGIRIWKGAEMIELQKTEKGFLLKLKTGAEHFFNKVLIATGGNSGKNIEQILLKSGHSLVEPVPSLFTFNIPEKELHQLAGISFAMAQIRIPGYISEGPLLITHWGLSGPAVLKASAWGARALNRSGYDEKVIVNFMFPEEEDEIGAWLNRQQKTKGSSRISRGHEKLSQRFWDYLVLKAKISPHKNWADLKKSEIETLLKLMVSHNFQMKGKTTFKEEFVTAGGISLKEVDFKTMQSRLVPGLYFAGEILDIDGVTGGFNFQNAWSTGWIAGTAMGGEK